jgi:hypothetical protein
VPAIARLDLDHGTGTGEMVILRVPADSPEEKLPLASVVVLWTTPVVVNGSTLGTGTVNGPDVLLGDGRGGWKASSDGLKVLNRGGEGLAVGDLDGDGNLDIIGAGNVAGDPKLGDGLFWFRGNGEGGWNLVRHSGLPTRGLAVPHGIALADLEPDGPQIIVLHGGSDGRITIWKRQ